MSEAMESAWQEWLKEPALEMHPHEYVMKPAFEAGYQAAKAETCEWVKDARFTYQTYQTSCGDDRSPDFVPEFCQSCGRKIVEKENQ